MHGGWCWRDVRHMLGTAGHEVHTPTLTGQGDRRHLLSRDVSVGTHVQDVTELLAFENLYDIHLVLHSYGAFWLGRLPPRRAIGSPQSFISAPSSRVLASVYSMSSLQLLRSGIGSRRPATATGGGCPPPTPSSPNGGSPPRKRRHGSVPG